MGNRTGVTKPGSPGQPGHLLPGQGALQRLRAAPPGHLAGGVPGAGDGRAGRVPRGLLVLHPGPAQGHLPLGRPLVCTALMILSEYCQLKCQSRECWTLLHSTCRLGTCMLICHALCESCGLVCRQDSAKDRIHASLWFSHVPPLHSASQELCCGAGMCPARTRMQMWCTCHGSTLRPIRSATASAAANLAGTATCGRCPASRCSAKSAMGLRCTGGLRMARQSDISCLDCASCSNRSSKSKCIYGLVADLYGRGMPWPAARG